jgi:hypothetical protein
MMVLVKLLGSPRMAMFRPSPLTSRSSWMPDVLVRELADVLGEDRVGETGRLALGLRRELQAAAVSGHHHRVEIGGLL